MDYTLEENVKYKFLLHRKERFHEQDGDKFVLDGFTYKLTYFEEFMKEIPNENAIAMVRLQQLSFEHIKRDEPESAIQFAMEYLIYNWKCYKNKTFNIDQWKYTVKVATEDLRIATKYLVQKKE